MNKKNPGGRRTLYDERTTTICASVPVNIKKKVRELAKERKISESRVIAEILIQHFKSNP